MKVLLIGYGSIGKRHEKVLYSMNIDVSIDIVTRQNLHNKQTFPSLKDVVRLDTYDYYIVASETNKHADQLKFLDANLKHKKILCEKPLFHKKENVVIRHNEVMVGYVLRFHPLLKKLKVLLEKEKVFTVNIHCGQYLPRWRPTADYRKSYSAFKNQGGGVLLDLSHEIDYLQWLFGGVEELKSYQVKISDLEIDSDDFTTFIGKTEKGVMLNVSMDYISKKTHRVMRVETLNFSYQLDFVGHTLIQADKHGTEKNFVLENLDRNDMFRWMHQSILKNEKHSCTFKEAEEVMQTIYTIQEENNG